MFNFVVIVVVLLHATVSIPVSNDVSQSDEGSSNNTRVIETSSSTAANNLSSSTAIENKVNVDITSGSSTKQTSFDAVVATTGTATTGRYTTGRYTTHYYPSGGSSELTGGEIALIVLGVLIFCCCCGGGTYYKTGHWETARVWVND